MESLSLKNRFLCFLWGAWVLTALIVLCLLIFNRGQITNADSLTEKDRLMADIVYQEDMLFIESIELFNEDKKILHAKYWNNEGWMMWKIQKNRDRWIDAWYNISELPTKDKWVWLNTVLPEKTVEENSSEAIDDPEYQEYLKQKKEGFTQPLPETVATWTVAQTQSSVPEAEQSEHIRRVKNLSITAQ